MKVTQDHSDVVALKEAHQFVWEEDEIETDDWRERLALQYYRGLFKEYALIDLSLFGTEKQIGLRWRTKKEVVEEKGTKICGSLTCNYSGELNVLEMPFQYEEKGEVKMELVKVSLCPRCTTVVIDK